MRTIKALKPSGHGHQFAFYGDSCSGVADAEHAQNLANVNDVVQRLQPTPEFIIFPGDEVLGLIPDETQLRTQWAHFFDVEMAWVKQRSIPMFHCTGNHTTYNRMSERVFADIMAHLPQNGPADQKGLSYFVRRDDLLLIFVNTHWSGLGGEGHVECEWLDQTLQANADAKWKFVVGHHPAFAVNGFHGSYQRTIGDEYVTEFWACLKRHGVMAYLCSHILAFDVQCHDGVLQITSAGAGTTHRMPEDVEYLHFVQMAVDEAGLHYQVLDDTGQRREHLSWPPKEPADFRPLLVGQEANLIDKDELNARPVCFRFSGTVEDPAPRQTLFAAIADSDACPLWVGLVGQKRQLTVVMQPVLGRSPHMWLGPCFAENDTLELDLLVQPQMGPGGFLWRRNQAENWTGLIGRSAWGADRLIWTDTLYVGSSGELDQDTLFAGEVLRAEIGVL